MSYSAKKAALRVRRHRGSRAKRGEVAAVLARVGTLARIADRFDEGDQSRAELLQVSRAFLDDLGPIEVSVAAASLEVSEPTIRAWVRKGLLTRVGGPGSGLDAQRLFDVVALVRDLRSEGHNRDLLNKVWQRLTDSVVLERGDLQESMEQMRQGSGIPTSADTWARELGIDD